MKPLMLRRFLPLVWLSIWLLAVHASVTKVQGGPSARIPVGVAKTDVTPTEPVVLAGYGGRTQPFEQIDTRLWARALVIGDKQPVVVVALDNCGVPRSTTDRLAKRLEKRGIARDHLVVAATHTHNAPTLVDYAPIVWQGRTTAEQDRRTAEYTTFVIEQMEDAIVAALENREPMSLKWGQGRVTFGGNRRVLANERWAGFGFQRDGPVDHSLPLLAARDASGDVRAVWVNYACHCTTVGSRNTVGGDWAGYANQSLETRYPKAISLTTIGCGADIGPQPSGSLEIAEQHGTAIAAEVARLLSSKLTPLDASPQVASTHVALPLETPPGREHWEKEAREGDGFHQQRARWMLRQLEKHGSIPAEVEYPVTVWRFADNLAMVFLAGEVVVDYSVRLKHELDWRRLWLTAWANEMPGYIPSRRVLIEGGYEADFSQVYYAMPGKYTLQVEDVLVAAVKELVGERFTAPENSPESPYHQERSGFHWLPSQEDAAFEQLATWAATPMTETGKEVLDLVRHYLPLAQPAIDRDSPVQGGQYTQWNNFAGDFATRRFIRQLELGAQLQWSRSVSNHANDEPLVLLFSGGLGWHSEPQSEGFALRIGDQHEIRFDVTRQPSAWKSKDGRAQLIYLPTWTSNQDSAGFFLVVCPLEKVQTQERIRFTVQSQAERSQRWFAIDADQKTADRLERLHHALELPPRPIDMP